MKKPLRELKGIGEKTEKLYEKLGVRDTEDLLRYYPRDYDVYEDPVPVSQVEEGTLTAIRASVATGVYVNQVRNLQIISVTAADESGRLARAR